MATASPAPPPLPLPPPWVELPREITGIILHKLGAVQILKSAQMVCKTWRSVCLDPAMWRVIDMSLVHDGSFDGGGCLFAYFEKMCRLAVDRSQGQLVDISIEFFATDDLLNYIAESTASHGCHGCHGCIHHDAWLPRLQPP